MPTLSCCPAVEFPFEVNCGCVTQTAATAGCYLNQTFPLAFDGTGFSGSGQQGVEFRLRGQVSVNHGHPDRGVTSQKVVGKV